MCAGRASAGNLLQSAQRCLQGHRHSVADGLGVVCHRVTGTLGKRNGALVEAQGWVTRMKNHGHNNTKTTASSLTGQICCVYITTPTTSHSVSFECESSVRGKTQRSYCSQCASGLMLVRLGPCKGENCARVRYTTVRLKEQETQGRHSAAAKRGTWR